MVYDELEDLRATATVALAGLSSAAGFPLLYETVHSEKTAGEGEDTHCFAIRVGKTGERRFAARKIGPFMGGWIVHTDHGWLPMHSARFQEEVQRACVPVADWLSHRMRSLGAMQAGASRLREEDSIRMELKKLPTDDAIGVVRRAGGDVEHWLE